MAAGLRFSASRQSLHRDGERLDPWSWRWLPAGAVPEDALPVEPVEAVARVHAAGRVRRVPVAVIGPRAATPVQLGHAEALGRRIGEIGLTLLCGGKGGVMEAACRGCLEAGGAPIGLLPDDEWDAANAHVAVPLATGLGAARNAVIARAATALVAVGGGHGTTSEMAFGLQFGRPVLTLAGAPAMEGAIPCEGVEAAVERLARHLLGLGPPVP